MDEIQHTIQIDPRPDSYRGFFDGGWSERFLDIARASKLRKPAFDLVRNWRAVSNARQIPWLMVECLDANMCHNLQECVPWDIRKIRVLRQKIVAKLEAKDERMRPMFRRKLEESMRELEVEACEIRDEVAEDVLSRRKDLWELLLEEEQFHTSIWSSERMCYGALYYSYECFLTECVRIKRRKSDYQMRRADDFKKDIKDAFGQELANDCWSDQKVNIARLARHALVHNGGRMTSVLQKQPHNFPTQDEEIQIGARHTTELYELLKTKAYKMGESVVRMDEFS